MMYRSLVKKYVAFFAYILFSIIMPTDIYGTFTSAANLPAESIVRIIISGPHNTNSYLTTPDSTAKPVYASNKNGSEPLNDYTKFKILRHPDGWIGFQSVVTGNNLQATPAGEVFVNSKTFNDTNDKSDHWTIVESKKAPGHVYFQSRNTGKMLQVKSDGSINANTSNSGTYEQFKLQLVANPQEVSMPRPVIENNRARFARTIPADALVRIKSLSPKAPNLYITVPNDKESSVVLTNNPNDPKTHFKFTRHQAGWFGFQSIVTNNYLQSTPAGVIRANNTNFHDAGSVWEHWLIENPLQTQHGSIFLICASTRQTIKVSSPTSLHCKGGNGDLEKFCLEIVSLPDGSFVPTPLPSTPVSAAPKPSTKAPTQTSSTTQQPTQTSTLQAQLKLIVPDKLNDGTQDYPLISPMLPSGLKMRLRTYAKEAFGNYLAKPSSDTFVIQDLLLSDNTPSSNKVADFIVQNNNDGTVSLKENSLGNNLLQAPSILNGTRVGWYDDILDAESRWAVYGTLDQCLLYNTATTKLLAITVTTTPSKSVNANAQGDIKTLSSDIKASFFFNVEFAAFPSQMTPQQQTFLYQVMFARQQASMATPGATPAAAAPTTTTPASTSVLPQPVTTTTSVAPVTTAAPVAPVTTTASVAPVTTTTVPTTQYARQPQTNSGIYIPRSAASRTTAMPTRTVRPVLKRTF